MGQSASSSQAILQYDTPSSCTSEFSSYAPASVINTSGSHSIVTTSFTIVDNAITVRTTELAYRQLYLDYTTYTPDQNSCVTYETLSSLSAGSMSSQVLY